jgi:hypothetical protein
MNHKITKITEPTTIKKIKKVKYKYCSVYFNVDILKIADKIATSRGVSRSQLINDLIIEECDRRGIK